MGICSRSLRMRVKHYISGSKNNSVKPPIFNVFKYDYSILLDESKNIIINTLKSHIKKEVDTNKYKPFNSYKINIPRYILLSDVQSVGFQQLEDAILPLKNSAEN
jgi:hypothetical protein